MALNSAERAELRQFLVSFFSLAELKDLAFDLGVDFQLFPHQTTTEFARELISYLERRQQLSCLVIEVLRQRHSNDIVRLLSKLPTCWRGCRMQIIVENDLIDTVSEALGELAGKLKIQENEIALFGANWGSDVRLLTSVAEGDEQISVPVISPIPAGLPRMSSPLDLDATIKLPRGLLADTDNLIAERMSVDDKGALLHRGDIVIIRLQEHIEDGQMAWIASQYHNNVMLRRFYCEGKRVRLQPADPTMDPVFAPLEEVRILGRLVMVIRKTSTD